MNESSDEQLKQALVHHQGGNPAQAEKIYRQVLSREPDNINALRLIGILFQQSGRDQLAIETLSRAVDLASDDDAKAKAVLLLDLGRVHHQRHQTDTANELFRRALALDPNNADVHSLLATNLARLGFITEAYDHVVKALALRPHPLVRSNLCLLSLNNPALSGEEVLQIHLDWARTCGAPDRTNAKFENDRAVDRVLRIAYVSPDLRQHPVRYFFQPLLVNHDRKRFHITCYSNVETSDEVTKELKALSDDWRDIVATPLDAVEQMVRADKIDILVDLAGHTQNSRIMLFTRKPAPVQVSMIGYPSTTGLKSIDYRITDAHCDPSGNERFSVEKLVRIDDTFWCFSQLNKSKAVSELPARSRGHITFGSVNSCSKLTDQVLDTWAQILAAVPGSKLLMQHDALMHASARRRIVDALARRGVASDRVRFSNFTPMSQFLDLISTFDIALDPFPFNGGTTTCHLLHSGVPVITLAGQLHAGRMGVSLLHAVGHEELIAQSIDEYVSKAIALAGDFERLSQIRAGLRDRMLASALCDAPGYTRKLEAAFRQMWKTWCESI